MMTPAKIRNRIYSFWFDWLFLMTFVWGLWRLMWFIAPGSEIRHDAMQLFTAKDFYHFFITAAASVILFSVYLFFIPWILNRRTFGQSLNHLRVGQPDGSPRIFKNYMKQFFCFLIRCALIFIPGPILAMVGLGGIFSIAGLILGTAFIAMERLFALKNPEGVGLTEQFAGIRYFHQD